MPTDRTLDYAGLVPMVPVTDVARSISFYEQLGFEVGNSHAPEEGAALNWAWLFNGKAHLMLNRSEQPVEATHLSVALWVYTADVVAAHEILGSRGLEVGEISYPFYNPRGEFHVHDPDGYAVFIAHAD